MEALRAQLAFMPANLAGHMLVTVVALAAGSLLSIPLAIVAVRSLKLRVPILSVISVVQTVPGLALLALTIPVLVAVNALVEPSLGVTISPLGFYPAVIALTLYSMLPIVRNTVTGILDIDPNLVEAGRGVGMTRGQILRRVELPLALPIIIAGLRTATVWTVGTATLATPVGQRCLGNFIFRGLQTRNWTAVLVGCVAAALLAMILDSLIALLQRGVETRRRGMVVAASSGLVALLALGLAAPRLAATEIKDNAPVTTDNDSLAEEAPASDALPEAKVPSEPIVVGGKSFTEQYILQEAIGLRLEAAGLPTKRLEGLGSTVIFDALKAGQVDVYVDYSGTIWSNHMKASGSAAPWVVLTQVSAWLQKTHGLRSLGALGFENAYALAMSRSRAEALKIRTIQDLAKHASALRIGADYEFFGRQEWRDLVRAYGLDFNARVTLDPTFMYGSVARGEVDVISAFSSDGRIASFDLKVLTDEKHAIPPYDAIVLLSAKAAARRDVVRALQPLIRAVPVEAMREANYMVDRTEDKRTVRQAAQWLLGRIGL